MISWWILIHVSHLKRKTKQKSFTKYIDTKLCYKHALAMAHSIIIFKGIFLVNVEISQKRDILSKI